MNTGIAAVRLLSLNKKIKKNVRKNLALYLMFIPAAGFTMLFQYVPLAGLAATFENYDPFKGFFGSPIAASGGLQHIIDIFRIQELYGSVLNTMLLSILNIILGFPAPIILALMINELRIGIFKKSV